MLQFTPNPRASGNLAITANARARMSSIVSVGWNFVTGKPNFDLLYQPISAAGTDYQMTSGASVSVPNDARTFRVNKTVGSATTLIMPAALNVTVQDIVIVDWKDDAGTNNITLTLFGSEKINGLSSWTIAGDSGSVRLRPIPNVGFALA
jgi:hypothetical protein